jgi:Oxidoreductase molybdopterin binding domain
VTQYCRRVFSASMFAVMLFALLLDVASAQTIPAGSLAIGGDVATPVTISAVALKQLPHTRIVVKEGAREITYEGVLVSELMKSAGAPIGQELAGRAIASYVLASASDGYQVVLAIAEVDPRLTDARIIVADTMDGQPLNDSLGPLRLIAPDDKHPSRSVRMLQRLDLVRLRK